MERREFLKKTAGTMGALGVYSVLGGCQMDLSDNSKSGMLPRRQYGKAGERLSIVGLGGMTVRGMEPERVNRLMAESVEKGMNYFDVAPTYGNAEELYGPALRPYRKKVFVACKTTQRDRAGAAKELAASLTRLQTDYLDLYQLHAINDVAKDVDVAFGKAGAMEVFIEAKKQGQVRHLGFSAHSEEAALAALERYEFDSVLFPVNFAVYYQGDFGPRVLAKAKKQGVSVLAIKSMAKQKWGEGNKERQKEYPNCWYEPLSEREQAALAMKFTLSQGATAIMPPGDERLCRLAMELAMEKTTTEPLTAEEVGVLKGWAAPLEPVFVG